MNTVEDTRTRFIPAVVRQSVVLVGVAALAFACSSPSDRPPVIYKPPLHVAIDAGDVEKVASLVKSGADLEEIYIGRTPLNAATLMDQPEIVERLLAAGARMEAVDSFGETALFLASSVSMVRPFIQHAANLNHRTNDGRTPLIAALYHGWVEVALLLIDHGADVSAQDHHGATPLMVAAANGFVDVADRLIREGADVNQTTNSGRSALLSSAYTGQTNVAKLLLDAGADVDYQDASGDSALHYCAVDGYRDLAELLLAHGANPRLKNRDGATPLQKGLSYSPYPGRVSRPTDKDGVISLLKPKDKP